MNWDPDKVVGALRNNRYRMVVEGNGQTQLYDMLNDPGQSTDLAADLPEIADSLRQEFDTWLANARSGGLQAPPIILGDPAAPETSLPAPEARLDGKLHFKGSGWANDWITEWQQPGDKASWPVVINKAGPYELLLHYNWDNGTSAPVFQLRLGSQTVETVIDKPFTGKIIPSPDRISRGEVYEKSWGEWPVKVDVSSAGVGELEIILQNSLPKEQFELKGVTVRAK
jgi:arylsulfatase A